MIIRDAIVSDEVRALRSVRGERPVASAIALAARESISAESAQTEQQGAQQLSAVAAPIVRAEPVLTFEAVAAWLAVQDGETRAACASLLTDELTLVHERAKADGFRSGELAGLQQARDSSAQQVAQLRAIGSAAEERFEQEAAALAPGCVEIVVAAFTKLAGSALVSREAALGAVEQVLARVKEVRELVIRLNAGDVATIVQAVDQLSDAFGGRKLQIVADARVELGGCIVESKHGSLDGRFESQLRELFETLRIAKAAASERP